MQDEIKVMQNEMACVNRQITGCDRDCIKCDLVLEDSEIIAAYEAAIEALEKQVPKKVLYTSTNGNYSCPHCERWISHKGQKYCKYCGQALDWSEVEE